MATYLALCQKVQRLAGIDANLVDTAPTAVTGQTGRLLEIVRWVNDAYLDIQRKHENWDWRRLSGTFNLSAGVRSYTQATVQGTLPLFDRPIPMVPNYRSFLLIQTASLGVSDQTFCRYVPYEEFRGNLDRGTRPTGKPLWWTWKPNQSFEFDPTPDTNAPYTVTLDYRRILHELTTDSDATTGTPILPDQYCDTIVWKALLYYALTRGDSAERMAKWKGQYKDEMATLEYEQLPQWNFPLDNYY